MADSTVEGTRIGEDTDGNKQEMRRKTKTGSEGTDDAQGIAVTKMKQEMETSKTRELTQTKQRLRVGNSGDICTI